MAYKSYQGNTPANIITLADNKAYSKNLLQWPVSKENLIGEQIPTDSIYWIMNEGVDAMLEENKKPLTTLFIKVFPDIELRQGLAREEIGFILSKWIDTTKDYVQPNDPLYYYRQDQVPIFRDLSKYEIVHLRAGWDTREFQYISHYQDAAPYLNMLAKQTKATALAIARTLNIVSESIILGTNPQGFYDNGLLMYVWGKNKQPGDDNNMKTVKGFFDKDSIGVKFIKKAAGDFAERLKNIIGVTPYYSLHFPGASGEWKFKIDKPAKPTNNNDETALKTALKKRYTQEAGANADNPPIALTRFACLYDACQQLKQIIKKMSEDESVENWMGFDPYGTAADTDKQYLCRANPADLIIIGNPADLLEMQGGGGVSTSTGPWGNLTLEPVTSLGTQVIPVYGMLPGEFLIIHKDCINLFQFYESTMDHENVAELVKQRYTHYMFRAAIFSMLPGCKLIYNKWIPGARDANKLIKMITAA